MSWQIKERWDFPAFFPAWMWAVYTNFFSKLADWGQHLNYWPFSQGIMEPYDGQVVFLPVFERKVSPPAQFCIAYHWTTVAWLCKMELIFQHAPFIYIKNLVSPSPGCFSFSFFLGLNLANIFTVVQREGEAEWQMSQGWVEIKLSWLIVLLEAVSVSKHIKINSSFAL